MTITHGQVLKQLAAETDYDITAFKSFIKKYVNECFDTKHRRNEEAASAEKAAATLGRLRSNKTAAAGAGDTSAPTDAELNTLLRQFIRADPSAGFNTWFRQLSVHCVGCDLKPRRKAIVKMVKEIEER